MTNFSSMREQYRRAPFCLRESRHGHRRLTQAWLMNSAAGIPYEGLTATVGMEVVIISVTFWTSFALATPLMRAAAATTKAHGLDGN